jgi:hypothetical protein
LSITWWHKIRDIINRFTAETGFHHYRIF